MTVFQNFSGNNFHPIPINHMKTYLTLIYRTMKNANETSKNAERKFDLFISEISEVEILNAEAMSCIRGGEGTGADPIIDKPKF